MAIIKALKIGLVFDDSLDRPDGVQQYVLNLGAWLSQQGHEVHYLVGQTARTDLPHLHSLARNVEVRFNGNRLTIPRPASKRVIRELLAAEKFDVLHVMMPYSPMMAAKIIRQAAPTTVVSGIFHILPQSRLVRLATQALGWWLWQSLKRFDYICATSSASRDFAKQAFRRTSVEVSPNVIDVQHFRLAQPLEKYHDDKATIVFLGRLVPRKGCQTLLSAVAGLDKANTRPFRVVICGKGPLEAELKAQAETLGLQAAVEFTGFIDEADKPRYLSSADIAVFPSTGGESFGIVLIEAMAASRPVVLAAANPGYAAVMEPRPNQLFEPDDVAGLTERLQYYLQAKPAVTKARAWQDEYVNQFDTAVVGQQLVSGFAELHQNKLQKKPQP